MILKKESAVPMPKNIVVDLNVILDVLLKRDGFEASKEVLLLHEMSGSTLHISAHMVTTFAYLLESSGMSSGKVLYYVEWLLEIFSIIPTNQAVLEAALKSYVGDFEDAVVEQSALATGASVIITRNINDFVRSVVPAKTPEELLATN